MTLYLKYRPRDFISITGQDHITTSIRNALKNNAVSHAYLFCGPRGTGKTSLARIIAKAINCLSPVNQAEPCNQCEICQNINAGKLVDLIEIDAASNRGIDEIRALREKIQFAPTQAKSKVYIIDEVHMLTKEAFNALLKTLEEPPEHAYFILATTEPHKIPETILSRCQQFNFQRIPVVAIINRLKEIALQEKIVAEEAGLKIIAEQANGGLRDAIGLFEQISLKGKITYEEVSNQLSLSGQKLIEEFFGILVKKEVKRGIELIGLLTAQGQSLSQFTTELLQFLREQMLLGIQKDEAVNEIIRWIEIFQQARQEMNRASITQLPLEIAAIRACYRPEINSQENKKIKPVRAAENKEVLSEKPADKGDNEPVKKDSEEKVTLELIKTNWTRIANQIETPYIRMSFLDSEPVKLERDLLYLSFNSEVLREKVENPRNQGVVLKAFEDLLGTKIKLKLSIKKIDLKLHSDEKDGAESNKTPTVMQMAEEVFGIKK